MLQTAKRAVCFDELAVNVPGEAGLVELADVSTHEGTQAMCHVGHSGAVAGDVAERKREILPAPHIETK